MSNGKKSYADMGDREKIRYLEQCNELTGMELTKLKGSEKGFQWKYFLFGRYLIFTKVGSSVWLKNTK
jgi:hypothetical protein